MSDDIFIPWTAKRVRNERMLDDKHWLAYPKYKDPNILKEFAVMAKKAGVKPVPTLQAFSDADYDNRYIGGATFLSREGHYYIHIQPAQSRQEILDMLAHELGHIKYGHLKPEIVAAELNEETNRVQRAQESKADDMVAILCLARPSASNYQRKMDMAMAKVIELGLPRDTFLKQSDPTHPLYPERIAALLAGAEHEEKAGRCPVPSKASTEKADDAMPNPLPANKTPTKPKGNQRY